MNNQNWQLQDDEFAPTVPDTLEHLPSHYCAPVPDCGVSMTTNAQPDIKTLLFYAQSGSCTCRTKTPEVKYHNGDCRYRALVEALSRIEALEHQLAEASKDATRYEWLRNKANYAPNTAPMVFLTARGVEINWDDAVISGELDDAIDQAMTKDAT